MLAQHAHRSLDAAAARTMARIRNDQAKVNGRLRPLLEHIEQHLFDPGLDVNQLKRRCGVRDNSIPIQFHAQLGQPPHAYIESCRLETACRLLRDTDLKVWQIANLLGYSSIQVFSRAFTRWAKQRPTSYRLQERRKRSGVPVATKAQAAIAAAPKQADTISLERALDGELDANQADRLIRRLLQLYPANGILMRRHRARNEGPAPLATVAAEALPFRDIPTPPPAEPDYSDVLSLEVIEQARAEALWEQIKDLPQEEMRAAIKRSNSWETDALFEHVRVRSMVDGREDRKRGVTIAELLLDIDVPFNEPGLVEPRHGRRGSAWTWIGNARTHAWDFLGAEEAFSRASEILEGEQRAVRLLGDLEHVQSICLKYQERLDEALDRASMACRHYEVAGREDKRARALAQKAAVLRDLQRYDECIKLADEAKIFFEKAQDKHMTLVMYTIIGRSYSSAGCFREALAVVKKARDAADGYSDSEYLLKFAWLEAEIAAQTGGLDRAQELYRQVIDGFVSRERPGEAASAALELAAFMWREGNDSAVVAILRGLLPTLEQLRMTSDAIAALALLEKSAARSVLSKSLFESARAAIEK